MSECWEVSGIYGPIKVPRSQVTLIQNPLLAVCSKALSGSEGQLVPLLVLSQGGWIRWHPESDQSRDRFPRSLILLQWTQENPSRPCITYSSSYKAFQIMRKEIFHWQFLKMKRKNIQTHIALGCTSLLSAVYVQTQSVTLLVNQLSTNRCMEMYDIHIYIFQC